MFSLDYARDGTPYLKIDKDDPSVWTYYTSSPDVPFTIETTLCDFCTLLVTNLFRQAVDRKSDVMDTFSRRPHLDGKVASLLVSASTCSLCRLMHQELLSYPDCESYSLGIDMYARLGFFYIRGIFGNSEEFVQMPIDLYQRSKQHGRNSSSRGRRFIVRESHPLFPLLLSVPESYPASPSHIELAMAWMADCRKTHNICAHARMNLELPKRVLDLSASDDRVSLHVSQPGELVPYATLSYRWGRGVPLKTTTHTIDRHRAGIPLDDFPRTLRESVMLARGLGFRYLWIDAPRIIQDSPADWAEQAAAMTSIYQGSSLNIAIADAPSRDTGTVSILGDNCLHVASSGVSGKSAEILIAARSFAVEPTNKAPSLSSRGWVFQETLVSVASLFVTGSGLIWECCSAKFHETGESTRDSIHSINSSKSEWASCQASQIRDDNSMYPTRMRAWHNWMAHFSLRNLTNKGDKLPAVAGLASHFSAFGSTYAAGLWMEDIHVGLTWFAAHAGTLVRRNDRAPSWSWASVDGAFEYPRWLTITKYGAAVHKTNDIDLDVLEVSVNETKPGTFGSVSGGYIKSIATLYQGTVCGDSRNPQIHFDTEDAKILKYTIDESVQFGDQPKAFWLARVCSVTLVPDSSRGKYVFYLILEEMDSRRSMFRRIGLAQGSEERSHLRSLQRPDSNRRNITLL